MIVVRHMVMSEAQGLSPSSVPGQVSLPLVLALLQELVTSGEPGDPPENFKVSSAYQGRVKRPLSLGPGGEAIPGRYIA